MQKKATYFSGRPASDYIYNYSILRKADPSFFSVVQQIAADNARIHQNYTYVDLNTDAKKDDRGFMTEIKILSPDHRKGTDRVVRAYPMEANRNLRSLVLAAIRDKKHLSFDEATNILAIVSPKAEKENQKATENTGE